MRKRVSYVHHEVCESGIAPKRKPWLMSFGVDRGCASALQGLAIKLRLPLKHLMVQLARKTGLKRCHLEGARMYLERQLLAAAARKRVRQEGRILCYHCFGQRECGVNDVHPRQFRRHLESALAKGYRFVPASWIANGKSDPKDLAITIDDGFKTVLDEAVPVLRELLIPFTLFVVSEWPSSREARQQTSVLTWDDLEQLVKQGAEVGSHSASHCDFGEIACDRAKEELWRSREMIAARLGIVPDSFAIPFGQWNNWNTNAHNAACEAGYTTIYAGVEDLRPPGTVGRSFVTYYDSDRLFNALLDGAYDRWEEWLCKC